MAQLRKLLFLIRKFNSLLVKINQHLEWGSVAEFLLRLSLFSRTFFPSTLSKLLLQLAIEVTSTNWEDDYINKLDEYQRLGITEYWIVDYQAIAPSKYLGNPKIPTIFVYYLVNHQYEMNLFIGDDSIISPTFSNLNLTVNQIISSQIA